MDASEERTINKTHILHSLEQDIRPLCDIYEININSTEYSKELSTLKSFSFMYDNAHFFASFVTPEYLYSRLHYLLSIIDKIPAPDCPELDLPSVRPEEVKFQKINRYLFSEIDQKILKYFLMSFPDCDFAFPTIEWAVNVLPDIFSQEQNKDISYIESLCKNIEASKINLSLIAYFKRGYECVVSKIHEIDSSIHDKRKLLHQLLQRLRCSMCYPARVSCVIG